jgi:hypothetical protein
VIRGVLVAAATLLLGGCGTGGGGSGVAALRPSDGRSGLYVSGTVAGRQLALTDGAPVLITGDCDLADGRDDDVCFVSRDIDGTFVRIVFENPGVLEPGTTVPVVDEACATRGCDDVTAGAVVRVQVGATADPARARGGSVRLDTVEPGQRYAGSLTLELPDGRLAGDFNVVPRPEE